MNNNMSEKMYNNIIHQTNHYKEYIIFLYVHFWSPSTIYLGADRFIVCQRLVKATQVLYKDIHIKVYNLVYTR